MGCRVGERPEGSKRDGPHTAWARDVQHCCHAPEADLEFSGRMLLLALPPEHRLGLPGIKDDTVLKYASAIV